MALSNTLYPGSLTQSYSSSMGVNNFGGLATQPDVRSAIIPQSSPTTFRVETPDVIPSTALTSGTTQQDVLNRRNEMEQAQTGATTQQQQFNQLLAGIQQNPNNTDFLSTLLFPQATETTQERDQLINEQRGLIGQVRDFISGRGDRDSVARLQELEQERGLPGLRDRLASSNERVANLRGELMKLRPQVEGEAGQTRVGAEARLNPAERQLNAEIAAEALVQQALVGNVQAAQQNVDRILSLEFADEEQQLQGYMQQLQLAQQEIATLDPQLQQEAQQRAQMLQFALTERANALQTAKEAKAGVLGVLTQAAQNGAPDQVLQAIKASQTPEQAMIAAGGYMQDQMALARLGLERRRVDLAERAQIWEEAAAGNPNAIAQLGYDPNNVNGGLEGARQYEMQTADIQAGIDAATAMLDNNSGLRSSTGAVQNAWLGGLFRGGLDKYSEDGMSVGKALSLTPGVGNVIGSVDAVNQKQNFLTQASFLVNDTTFQEIRDLRAQGVTFGNMTEGERKAAGRAANALNAAVIVDESGAVTGFRGSEDLIRGYIKDIKTAYEGRQEFLNTQYAIDTNEEQEARQLWESN